LYTHVELRSLLNAYITAKQLKNANDQAYVNVSADQALLEALSDGRNKEKNDILAMEFMKRDEVLRVLMEKMQAWYEIRCEGKDTVVKFVHFNSFRRYASFDLSSRKGQLKPISVITKRRQGRVMTLITGFESFFLVADELAEDLRKACASSTAG
jgi:translation initiation factor 2D